MRLTEKDKQSFSYNIDYDISSDLTDGYDLKNGVSDICYTIGKLGQLEDIEEELGIDLIIFLKALTHGFYYKNKDRISTMSPDEIALGEGGFSRKEWEGDTIWFFKDFGKTWALTKEELK